MKTKIAINGFGRIGRNAFKIAFERPDLEVAAVNDLTDTKTLAHLLKHDSNYGTYQHDVSFDEENIIVDGQKIKVLAEKDPTNLPWGDMGVGVVIEATGLFTHHDDLKKHLQAGAKKVILSAPEKDDNDHDTFVLGVNEKDIKPEHEIFSNASCTTNCITPVMAILEQEFGIEKAFMTTIHSYTASQRLQDAPAKDLREARNAAENIVPTTTGASIAAAKALPALDGIFGGMSVRVPTPVVSLSDFAVILKKDVTVEQVNEAFKKAAADPYYQGILDVAEEPLVSSDYIGNSHSAIVDLALTAVVGGNFVKVVAWYDNEWGYSNRLVELTADVAKLLNPSAEDKESKDEPDADKHEDSGKEDASPGPTPDEIPGLVQEAEPALPAPHELLEGHESLAHGQAPSGEDKPEHPHEEHKEGEHHHHS
ncbi:MAG TPA: type I glyceraldehyde-3-phosphate dehydrogenase [Candidatus Saccharimonadales bacterium]|nr:type I glyceraldehyde-3-phosphate dehydrogenase [Candidatus Saccharimonadales bacterium]